MGLFSKFKSIFNKNYQRLILNLYIWNFVKYLDLQIIFFKTITLDNYTIILTFFGLVVKDLTLF